MSIKPCIEILKSFGYVTVNIHMIEEKAHINLDLIT